MTLTLVLNSTRAQPRVAKTKPCSDACLIDNWRCHRCHVRNAPTPPLSPLCRRTECPNLAAEAKLYPNDGAGLTSCWSALCWACCWSRPCSKRSTTSVTAQNYKWSIGAVGKTKMIFRSKQWTLLVISQVLIALIKWGNNAVEVNNQVQRIHLIMSNTALRVPAPILFAPSFQWSLRTTRPIPSICGKILAFQRNIIKTKMLIGTLLSTSLILLSNGRAWESLLKLLIGGNLQFSVASSVTKAMFCRSAHPTCTTLRELVKGAVIRRREP